jgi:hypothetical protein
VDTLKWSIRWSVDSETLVEATISEQMRDKALYLVIFMGHKEDEV